MLPSRRRRACARPLPSSIVYVRRRSRHRVTGSGWVATPHTVQVRTVHQHVVRREAPAPVPEVRTGGLYRGAPCTVGTKDRLHRSLCAPSVFSKSRTLLANMTKMSEAYPQTLKNSCYNNVCAWHLRPKGHLTYQRSHFDYILTVLRPFS